MSWEYSENILVQNSAGNVLVDKLGWEVVFAYNEEVLGENGTLGRKNYEEIVLTRYLKKALFENNDWMTEEYCASAMKSLSEIYFGRNYLKVMMILQFPNTEIRYSSMSIIHIRQRNHN